MIKSEKPKYRQIYEQIRASIEQGGYAVGSKLPTESSLADLAETSRITVRKALDQLVHDGFLNRRQGSGYHVISSKVKTSNCLSSFTEIVYSSGHTPSTKVLSVKIYPAMSHETLRLPPELQRETELVFVERVRSIDNDPKIVVHTWIPHRLVPGISINDFAESGHEQSMIYVLEEKYGLSFRSGCEEIRPLLPTPEIAQLLKISKSSPVIQQSCTVYSENKEVMMYDETYRIDVLRFDLNEKGKAPV